MGGQNKKTYFEATRVVSSEETYGYYFSRVNNKSPHKLSSMYGVYPSVCVRDKWLEEEEDGPRDEGERNWATSLHESLHPIRDTRWTYNKILL